LLSKRRLFMKTKAIWILTLLFIGGTWTIHSAFAQQRGHTGGLGEARIYFNVSSAANLAKAPGITLKIAKAIVEYREEKPFKKPEDLLNVPGITKDVYKQINPKRGTEGELYTVPREGEELEEDEDMPLSPSKC
jgi:competence ComEA-like helix-hairpin-helix protein